MTNGSQHVVPRGDQRVIVGAGARKATGVFDRKQDGVDRAREISRNQQTELVVH